MDDKVRYRVVATCFVNGSIMEPNPKEPVYVMAAPGLAGPALQLVDEQPANAGQAHRAKAPPPEAGPPADEQPAPEAPQQPRANRARTPT